jgi:hypothetical protein
MANVTPNGPANVAPARVAPVVVQPPIAAVQPTAVGWRRLLPAWVISGIVHILLLALFLQFSVQSAAEPVGTEQAVIETKVDDAKPPPNLEEPDVGLDPDLPTNYNIPRIEEISVPGPVNASEAAGVLNAPESVPTNVPPPPGLGTSQGQGGGVDAPNPGKANLIGLPGGIGGPLMRPGGFGGRSGATREQMLKEGGGNTASEAAVARGLIWLIEHQAPDGHWSLDHFNQYGHCNCTGRGMSYDVAATAFGLLPLLGAGQTHRPAPGEKGHKYAKNVERALKYLMLKQNAQGDFGGGMYSHGLATIAVCEAYGMTSDPSLQRSAQRAINFIVSAQSDNGGWRYTPRSGGDTSVVGWEVMALKSGQMAGLEVPSRTLAGATRWLDSVASPDGGGYGYTEPADGPSAMTAVGLLCREYLGWGPRNPGLQAGVNKLKQLPPKAAGTMYYTYYATQVMHHMGGEAWAFWNPRVRDLLISRQDQGTTPGHPHQRGSWDPKGDAHGNAGGRIMITSLSLLTLEVYYRHLPLYRRDQMGGAK